jgi:hypothetical protein
MDMQTSRKAQDHNRKNKKGTSFWLTILTVLFITFIAASVMVQSLRFGVWAYSDSAAYIAVGQSLFNGQGLGIPGPQGFMPLNHYPPLYPLVIWLFLFCKIEPLAGLAWFNLVVFIATVMMMGLFTYKLTRNSLLSISVCLLVGVSPVMIRNFDGAMTEPLYICLSSLGMFLLAEYWHKPKLGKLIAAGIVAGLAGLLRYVGITLVMCGLIIIFLTPQSRKTRLSHLGTFLSLGAGLLLIWLLFTFNCSGMLAGRDIAFGENLSGRIFFFRKNVMEVLVSWLPYTYVIPSWRLKALAVYAFMGFGIGTVGVVVWRIRLEKSIYAALRGKLALLVSAVISIISYVCILLATYLFTSITPDVNDRLLSPLFPALVVFLCVCIFLLLRVFKLSPYYQAIPMILILFVGQYDYIQSIDWAKDREESTRGYAATRYSNSELISVVQELPDNLPLISNMPALILLYCNRLPFAILELEQKKPLSLFTYYGEGEDIAQEEFRLHGATLIIFKDDFQRQMEEIYGNESESRIAIFFEGAYMVIETVDGAIYYHAPTIRR